MPFSPAEALECATNKYAMRSRLYCSSIERTPHAVVSSTEEVQAAAGAIGYPVVLKPLTGVGSSLIYRINNRREARVAWIESRRDIERSHFEHLRMARHTLNCCGAWMHFDPSSQMLIEPYFDGPEASVECVVMGVLPRLKAEESVKTGRNAAEEVFGARP